MGLSITAYTGLEEDGAISHRSEGLQKMDNANVTFPANSLLSNETIGIPSNAQYIFTDAFNLSVGSYTDYFEWREELANLAGYSMIEMLLKMDGAQKNEDAFSEVLPFGELIFFSDTEGMIGPGTSAKLAKDFSDFEAMANAHMSEAFKRRYHGFKMAFKLAAISGMVVFH